MKKLLEWLALYRETVLSSVAMVGSIMVLTALQYIGLDRRFHDELMTQARIVSQNTAAALMFDAPSDARDCWTPWWRRPR